MLYIWGAGSPRDYAGVGVTLQSKHRVLPFKGFIPPEVSEGDVLFVLGDKAIKLLAAAKVIPKGRTPTKLRQQVFNYDGCKVLISYNVGVVKTDIKYLRFLQQDFLLANRLALTGTLLPDLSKTRYEWVESFEGVIDYLGRESKRLGSPLPVSIDLETVGFDPYAEGAFIVSISITPLIGQSRAIRFRGISDSKQPAVHGELNNVDSYNQVKFLATATDTVKVYGANFKFDQHWMSVHWGINEWPTFHMDTTIVGSLLDENRSNALSNHAFEYTSIGGYDLPLNHAYDKGRMDLVPDGDLLTYACGDTDAGLRVGLAFEKDLNRERGLKRLYKNILHPAAQAFSVIERRGLVMDYDRHLQVRSDVVSDIEKQEETILGLFPQRLKIKYDGNLSLTRAVILRDYLFTPLGLNLRPEMATPTGLPSTTLEHLKILSEKHDAVKPFLAAIEQYNTSKKTLSTFIDGFIKHRRSDGKYHPTYFLHNGMIGDNSGGTDSGRSTCINPPYQVIPKRSYWAKALRRIFTPPPGFGTMNVDVSQGELKWTACVANEATMIAVYLQGADLHLISGAQVAGYTETQLQELKQRVTEKIKSILKSIRQRGKAVNFGLIYGMSAKGLQAYAKTAFGVVMTLQEATIARNAYFQKYSGLLVWHEKTKQYLHLHKQVVSPLGRIRHLPLIDSPIPQVVASQERIGVNAQIQSSLSDSCLWAVGELNKVYPSLWVFGFTHDAISFYYPLGEHVLWANRVADVMENLPYAEVFGWQPQLKFTVDAEYSEDSMGDWAEFDFRDTTVS